MCFRRFTTGQGCLVAVNFPVVQVDIYIFWGWRLLRRRRDEAEAQRCDRERERVVEGEPGPSDAEVGFRGNLLPASLPTTCGHCELFSHCYCAFKTMTILFLSFWPSLGVFCINDKSSIPEMYAVNGFNGLELLHISTSLLI